MNKSTASLIHFLFIVILVVPTLADPAETEKRTYTAQAVNPHAPLIDGKLEDPIWQKAAWGGDFVQREPYDGKAPSQATAFKILYDEENLYVAIRAYDIDPKSIERRLSRRDDIDGDRVGISLDSYYDQRTAFAFAVNAAGVRADYVMANDGDSKDLDWDPIWYVKTALDEEGWTAEVRIPLSQLRYGNKDSHVWGLQVTRILFRKEETSCWQHIPRDAAGWVSQFGRLEGIQGIHSQRQVELRPYAVGSTQQFARQEGNPFATGSLNTLLGGLDGKIGVTSDMTLDFTINPDFGQVEADPSVVNLTAFETYFEEKRPFFIEGRNILSFRVMLGDGDMSSDNLFYTRRIGRPPHHYPEISSGEYADVPANTSILGAFKLTGKTKNGLSIGIVESLTSTERASLSFMGQLREEAVEPLTNYFGLRLQKDYRQGNTVFGAMVTATNRNIQDSHLDYLHRAAYTGGVDFEHWWKDRTYMLDFNVVFSHVLGSEEALLRTQMSSLRYFQRPDAAHVSLDSTRTSLSGHGGTAVFGRLGSGHLKYIGGVTWRSPGLELNDMGYLRDADVIMQFIWASYRIWEPFSIFRTLNFNFNQWMGWNFGGERRSLGGNFGIYGQFKNYYSYSIGISRNEESLAKSLLRGGPSLRYPGAWNPWINLESDSRKRLRFEVGMSGNIRDDGGSGYTGIYGGLAYTPSSALSFKAQPMFSTSTTDLQYVGTRTFGNEKRYIFGRLAQKTLAVTLRLNLFLTPDLSIQFYGQPFVSAGKYGEFKRIIDSRADSYQDRFSLYKGPELSYDTGQSLYKTDEDGDGTADYSFGNPNFNFLQFRSNLVVRWEYLPGSVLYLVWSQGRTGVLPHGEFSFGNDIQNLFDIHPHNVFLVKFSYTFQF